MFRDSTAVRQLLLFGFCLVLAPILGFALADPLQLTSIGVVALCFGILALPLLLHYQYPLLIFAWNAAVIVFFLPGQPKLAFVMAVVSLILVVVARPLRQNQRSVSVPSVAWSLVFIAIVVLITAKLTGGMGARSLGGETWGGKRYLGVLGAVVGYFALCSQAIPRNRAVLYSSLFFLSGLTAAFSDFAYAAGPAFYFLFNFFPAELASSQYSTQDSLLRLQGVAVAALSGCYFLLMRYGIAGMVKKPWRGIFFVALVLASLLGGFRSALVIIGLLLIVQCCFEGTIKTPLFPALVGAVILIGSLLIGFADKLPLSMQRSLSFLPIQLDVAARMDAQSTFDWRIEMWKTVLPDVPRYFWLGKGFSFNGTDYYLTQQAGLKGLYSAYEDTLISGNYHSGPLTIIIPFGIFGVIGFVWFCIASLRVLGANLRFSDPTLRPINVFLISFFVARLIYYLVFYGQFDLDLVLFVGIVGFSIALNNGVRAKKDVKQNEMPRRLSLFDGERTAVST